MKARIAEFFMIILIACLGCVQNAHAVSPPPDGGYPNFTTAEGTKALQNLTTGAANTGVGWYSLFSAGPANYNTGIGAGALALNTSDSNTAVGTAALLLNSGAENTAVGTAAMVNNDTGSANSAFGAFALRDNTTGDGNTGFGFAAIGLNTIGTANTAIGFAALGFNTSGDSNTATGSFALSNNTTGGDNTANGRDALSLNSDGGNNTADGWMALSNNTTGDNNTAVGSQAGANISTASNVTCIGANVTGLNVNNSTWIAHVFGVSTQSGNTAPVVVSDGGQLGTLASSKRFKKDIATMEKASEAILSLRPVTFHYKTDTKGTPQFGLIAEEVAKVNPALVLSDKEGKPFTVRYDAVNAMLLNEFLKEHRKVQELESTVAKQEASAAKQDVAIAQQQKQIEALTAGLQKVSAQLAASRPSLADSR